MIFVLRQIQEKCRQQNVGLYAAFVDLTKAFDTVSRDRLWKFLACLGCPPKFPTILRQLHEGQQGQVKHNGSLSGSLSVSSYQHQMFLAKDSLVEDLLHGVRGTTDAIPCHINFPVYL